jgi:hypothetical protein
MKLAAKIAVGLAVALVAMQAVRCDHGNPPVVGEVAAPAEVKSVLRRACYDCHSNETRWPWYSQIAPVSWLIGRDVKEGRRLLNFSEWSTMLAERRARKRRSCGKRVASGDMPLWFYLPLHADARLSEAEQLVVRRWADGAAEEER